MGVVFCFGMAMSVGLDWWLMKNFSLPYIPDTEYEKPETGDFRIIWLSIINRSS